MDATGDIRSAHALVYDPQAGWRECAAEPAAVSDHHVGDASMLWVAVELERFDEQHLATFAERYRFHPLAVEDALNPRQRPKLERYERHLFFVLHQLDEHEGQLEPVQLACFIGSRHVFVVHHGARRTIEETERRLRAAPKELKAGSELLIHALLDTIVDSYQVIANRLEEEVETLEELVLADPRTAVQRSIYSVKQQVARMRRYAFPVEQIMRIVIEPGRPPVLDEGISHYFRDVHDHALRIVDQVRNIDDLANAILDLHRAEQANAQNEVTKRLTAWAAIIAVPTFISSVYGMNFALLPTEGSLTGFGFALGLMVAVGLFLFAFFKRRRWI